jgi:enoyl-CoA hydratase
MSSSVLKVEREGELAILTLNRPEAMNALSRELRYAIGSSFRAFQAGGDTRVVIVTGAGRAFCAGFDLKELAAGSQGDTAESAGSDMADAMAAFGGPIIAAVNGHAITGGFELALACDILIASREAKFADTHVRVGMLPGWGLSQKLPRLIGVPRAKELSFTGNSIGAEQAEAWGLVNRVVSAEHLLPCCRALAREMLSCDARALRGYKRLIDRGCGMSFADAMEYESGVALESARAMSADAIAARREAVMERGRRQGDS